MGKKIFEFEGGPIGENAYLIVDEATKETAIIDPGFFDERIEKAIKDNESKLKYIILTHGHGDHIGGIPRILKKYDDVLIVAHKEEAEMLRSSKINCSKEIFGKAIELEADIWVEESDSLKLGELELKFIHTPGHSNGGMCILLDDVVFSGDTLFKMSIGRTDFPQGSMTKIIKSIKEKLFKLPDNTKVYPGHMDSTDIGYEKRNNPFV
ncbi:MAG: MBL fold metallo-hydrolase [Peptostreptococcaceae bacterium]|nr:MBL fold metallo-hydrolase [Peptostreptococcaceae bacterium]